MSSVSSNASSKTWTPLNDRFIDEHLVVRSSVNSAAQRHESGCDTHAPAASLNVVVYRVQVGLLAGHRAGAIKSGVSQVNSCTVSRALWAGALSC